MAREEVVVGLDIGTTKVCTVVGYGDEQGHITIAGVGLAPSRGVKKGVVVDVDDTVAAIQESVDRARHMAGVEIHSVVAGVTGEHMQSSNRRGTVTIAGDGGTVTEDDVQRVMQAATMDVPRNREIIHSLPRDFSVDGQKGVRRPIGMSGQRLEVESHIVTGQAGFLQNVVQCIERAGLEVDSLVLEPIATSEAVATADERELGVALIDIGGGTADIAVFQNGSIVFSVAVPVGGNHVTRDISIGLHTPFEIAERLKVERGIALPGMIPQGEALEFVSAGSGERLRLPRTVLGGIIEARMSEMFEMARTAIEEAGVPSNMAGSVILTGGGALLPGSVELAQQIFNLPVRIGTPLNLSGWSDKVDTPQFATAVGLLHFALRRPGTLGNPLATASQPDNQIALADPQRRIWSMPVSTTQRNVIAEPKPAVAATPAVAAPAAVATLSETAAPAAAPVESVPNTTPAVAEPTGEPVVPDDFALESPSESLHDPFEHLKKAKKGNEDDEPPAPIVVFFRKLLAKVRDELGFETV